MCQAGTVIRTILQMRRLRLELGSSLRKDTQPVSKWQGQMLSLGVLACPCQLLSGAVTVDALGQQTGVRLSGLKFHRLLFIGCVTPGKV